MNTIPRLWQSVSWTIKRGKTKGRRITGAVIAIVMYGVSPSRVLPGQYSCLRQRFRNVQSYRNRVLVHSGEAVYCVEVRELEEGGKA